VISRHPARPLWPNLPADAGEAAWDRLLGDDRALRRGVDAIVQRHRLGPTPPRRFARGSLPVYAIGPAQVLKLYPPTDVAAAEVEARTLAAVHGRLPWPTPEPQVRESIDGWPYLLMSRLHGQPLADAWPALAADDRARLADGLGAGLAVLHGLDTAALADLPPPHWQPFIRAQRTSAVERQARRGLEAAWLEPIDAFLDRWAPPAGAGRALLHTEVMREHLLVEPQAGRWRISGLVDFEPAMLGEPLYEFASVGLFVAGGDASLLTRTLRAHGGIALEPGLPQRLLAMALLHRYANLRWYLQRLPAPGARTLEALAERWFGIDPPG
jgi:hygromycin-B 7''-O-kinase